MLQKMTRLCTDRQDEVHLPLHLPRQNHDTTFRITRNVPKLDFEGQKDASPKQHPPLHSVHPVKVGGVSSYHRHLSK